MVSSKVTVSHQVSTEELLLPKPGDEGCQARGQQPTKQGLPLLLKLGPTELVDQWVAYRKFLRRLVHHIAASPQQQIVRYKLGWLGD